MYDIGFRIAALKIYSYFLSLRKTSKILNISISTISRWNANICIKKRNRIPVKNSEFGLAPFENTPVMSDEEHSRVFQISLDEV